MSNYNLRRAAESMAIGMLKAAHGEEQAKIGSAKVSLAIAAARAGARQPQDFDRAAQNNPTALAQCVAVSIGTDLYPGGPNPPCYVIPQGGRLNWRISHRGVCILASRAGYHVQAVPVHVDDVRTVEFGQLTHHEYRAEAMSLDELAGVVVIVRRMGDTATLTRVWVSVERIMDRKKKTRTGPVWNQWPIEMAQKTAIIYAASRGTIPIDSPAWDQAITAEYRATEAPRAQVIDRPMLAAPAEALALTDGGLMDVAPSEWGEQAEAVPVEANEGEG